MNNLEESIKIFENNIKKQYLEILDTWLREIKSPQILIFIDETSMLLFIKEGVIYLGTKEITDYSIEIINEVYNQVKELIVKGD